MLFPLKIDLFLREIAIQVEKITCGSMGGAKSFVMKCFVLIDEHAVLFTLALFSGFFDKRSG